MINMITGFDVTSILQGNSQLTNNFTDGKNITFKQYNVNV